MQRKLPILKRTAILLMMSLCFALEAWAQTKITGKVSGSDDKLPVIGASVKIKNSPGGTITDEKGAFTLEAKPTDVLIISFVGYATREVTVGRQISLNILLQPNNNNLTEVVVTGYTSQRKKDLTGAVSVVDVVQLKAQPAASAVEALQGKAPGVQIVNDGAPGSTPQIRIRGFSTINDNDPLYIIDGVPYEGKLSWLNQNDIESLQVLKDASSASIYGARANNGVVIITTKKGVAGPPKITLDTYYGIQVPRRGSFPQMMSPIQYADYLFTSYKNTFAGGYLDQQGTLKFTGFSRYNFRSNTAISAFNKKVRFGENAQYSYSEGHGLGVNPNVSGEYQDEGSAIGWAYRIPTIIPVYDIEGNYAGSRGSGLGNAQNPVAFLDRAKDNVNKSNFFFGNAYAEADIIDGLVARTSFGLRYENYDGIALVYPNLEFSEGSNTNSLNEDMGYNTEWTWTNTLTYKKVFNEKHRLTILAGSEAIKNRTRELDGGRNDYFVLGSPDYNYLNTGSSNISNASFGTVGSLFSLFGRADYSYNDRYLASITMRRDGSSNFGPQNKYGYFPAASVAWRLSEESFLKSQKWITDFKLRAGYGKTGNQRIPGFQYLNRYQSSIINSAYATGGGNGVVTGVWQDAYTNPNVKWESLSSINLGTDFTLLDGQFDGSFDWYNRKTKDMLYPVPLPSTAVGLASSPYVNVGDMDNKGFEISLGYHYGHKNDHAVKFDVGLNFSRNINKITRLAPTVSNQPYGVFRSLTTSILETGEPFGSFYGYKVQGIYQNQAEITNSASYTGARVGGFRYEDVNGDGAITPADRTIIGNPNPAFLYSISLNVSYKSFDIAAFFNGVQGNDLYEATRYFTDFPTFDGARSTRLLNAWSPTNTSSLIPSPYVGVSDMEYASSSYYVQNGSFLRFKNLQIGYTVPAKKLFGPNSGFSKLRVYVSATNLFTITKYTGLDPEVSQETDTFSAPGVDRGIYPSPRQYLLGINAAF